MIRRACRFRTFPFRAAAAGLGLLAVTGALLGLRSRSDDNRLDRRLRSRLPRPLLRLQSVRWHVRDGFVQVYGAVPAEQMEPLLDAILTVPGVVGIDNELDIAPAAT